jgi:hypothetical protein
LTDGIVQLQPDSSGKKVDTSELSVGTNTVERQRVVIADDATAAAVVHVETKGAQGVYGLTTQDFKDSGRSPVTLWVDDLTTGVTTEGMASVVMWRGGSSATSTNAHTVTAGKTLRLTSFSISCRAVGATAGATRARLRSNSGNVTTTSAVVAALAAGTPAASTNSTGFNAVSFGEGYEIAAGVSFSISHIESATNTVGVTYCVTGYEY